MGQAQLALLRGDADRARRLADESLELAAPTGSRKYESRAWRIKGESARLRRAWDEADEALQKTAALFEPRLTWITMAALGRLGSARGRHDSGAKRYAEAWMIAQRLRDRTNDPAVRAGLESHPMTRELADIAAS